MKKKFLLFCILVVSTVSCLFAFPDITIFDKYPGDGFTVKNNIIYFKNSKGELEESGYAEDTKLNIAGGSWDYYISDDFICIVYEYDEECTERYYSLKNGGLSKIQYFYCGELEFFNVYERDSSGLITCMYEYEMDSDNKAQGVAIYYFYPDTDPYFSTIMDSLKICEEYKSGKLYRRTEIIRNDDFAESEEYTEFTTFYNEDGSVEFTSRENEDGITFVHTESGKSINLSNTEYYDLSLTADGNTVYFARKENILGSLVSDENFIYKFRSPKDERNGFFSASLIAMPGNKPLNVEDLPLNEKIPVYNWDGFPEMEVVQTGNMILSSDAKHATFIFEESREVTGIRTYEFVYNLEDYYLESEKCYVSSLAGGNYIIDSTVYDEYEDILSIEYLDNNNKLRKLSVINNQLDSNNTLNLDSDYYLKEGITDSSELDSYVEFSKDDYIDWNSSYYVRVTKAVHNIYNPSFLYVKYLKDKGYVFDSYTDNISIVERGLYNVYCYKLKKVDWLSLPVDLYTIDTDSCYKLEFIKKPNF